MLSKVTSCALEGLDGYLVEIEVDITNGLPAFDIVGLPDISVKEAKERVRAAVKNSGFEFPNRRVTVNLAPGDRRKEGPFYDLPIAIGLLAAGNENEFSELTEWLFLGELGLDGSLRGINGVLPLVLAGVRNGKRKIFIPRENAKEGALIEEAVIYPANNLLEVYLHLKGEKTIEPYENNAYEDSIQSVPSVDFAEVKGQEQAKRAIEIAAAGFHNLLMIGPPGSGKTMLARRIPTVLPELTREEALEITKIYSVAGLLPHAMLTKERPFRSPHHTASTAGIIGGGRNPRPGEVSLSHLGVLFFDELPEFRKDVLEVMRQPLEDGVVTISRANGSLTYPADFIFVGAANPCPCGYYGDEERECACTPLQIQRYRHKFSGPILDRIDLHLMVPRIKFENIYVNKKSRTSEEIRRNVLRATEIQRERYRKEKFKFNGRMTAKAIRRYCNLSREGEKLLENAFNRLRLSVRAHDRILKVARTIADLAGEEKIQLEHLAEAIGYRNLDREILY